MDELDYLIDLHRGTPRQGPGSDEATRLALSLSGLPGRQGLDIADIGCGSGASTLVLARELDARITAVDLVPAFLEQLDQAAHQAGLAGRIETRAGSMDALGLADRSLDAIWSEGAIYNIGFETGIARWRRFLKPGGVLAVSELTWLTHERPEALSDHWMAAYPEVATASAKLAVLEAHGYCPLGYLALPQQCWVDNYYAPLEARFAGFLDRHDNAPGALAVVEATRAEISLYEQYSTFFGYGFYVAQKLCQ